MLAQNSTLSTESWRILVVRASNWRSLHSSKKSWRPLIRFALEDSRSPVEGPFDVLVGGDGHSPNLLHSVVFPPGAHSRSSVTLSIYCEPSGQQRQSKGSKQRQLLGETQFVLGEALRGQACASDQCHEVKIAPVKGGVRAASVASKVMSVWLRIKVERAKVGDDGFGTPSPFGMVLDTQGLRRRKGPKVRGPGIDEEVLSVSRGDPDSDDYTLSSASSTSSDIPWNFADLTQETGHPYVPDSADGSTFRTKGVLGGDSNTSPTNTCGDKAETYSASSFLVEVTSRTIRDVPHIGDRTTEDYADEESLLPRWFRFHALCRALHTGTDRLDISTISDTLRGAFDAVTFYPQLRKAATDEDLKKVLNTLIEEWQWVAGVLSGVAALDATVFGFSTGTLFDVDGVARHALTISAIVSALGLAVDVGMLFFYREADIATFQSYAQALYSSYFYFSLTSRLPLLAALISLVMVSVFLLAVAYTLSPAVVLVISGIAGILVGLQYVVKAVEVLGRAIGRVARVLRVDYLCGSPVQGDAETQATHAEPAATNASRATGTSGWVEVV